jgi:hypothetical protein
MLGLVTPLLTVTLAVGVPLQGPKENGQENLPVLQRTSKPVQHDDLEFQLVSDAIWPLPARAGNSNPKLELPTGASPVRFQLRITNHQKNDIRLLSIVGTPVLQSADGTEFKVDFYGGNGLGVPKFISLAAGQTITVKGGARLYGDDRKGTALGWVDEFGTHWGIDGIKPGKYVLRLRYNTQRHAEDWTLVKNSGAWLGEVRTAEVPVEIVDLQASQPVVCTGLEATSRPDGTWELKKATERGWKDDLEVAALADGTWRAPATGKPTQVCLGFRMKTVEKWKVRIIPSIAMVRIKSAGGVELPVKKTTTTVPAEAPQLLVLRPEYSFTVATPAALFHDGKTMTLAWADRSGQVWHVENLQPGRHVVQYLIQAEKGEPALPISFWVGEVWTAPVIVEIKE